MKWSAVAAVMLLLITGSADSGSTDTPTPSVARNQDVYVLSHNKLWIIDNTNTIAGSIPLDFEPDALTTSSDGSRLYVMGYGSASGGGESRSPGRVAVFDANRRSLEAKVEVGTGFGDSIIAVTADGKVGFTYCSYCEDIYRIDLQSNTVASVIPGPVGGDSPIGMVTSSDSKLVYVVGPSQRDLGASTLSILDVAANRIVKSVEIGYYSSPPELSADGARIFLTSQSETPFRDSGPVPNQILVLDAATLRLERRIMGDIGPTIVRSPDGSSIYSLAPSLGIGYKFTVVSTESLNVSTFTSTAVKPSDDDTGGAAPSLIFSHDSSRVYLIAASTGGNGTVVAMDTASHDIVGTVPATAFPTGGQLSTDGHYLYVPSSDLSGIAQLVVIDTAKLEVEETITLA